MENQEKTDSENEKEKKDSLKEKYNELKEKYSLPEFTDLNKEFGIEKLDEDAEFLLREVIHNIADKIQNYMRFLENIVNPSSASMFIFSLVKILDNGKRKTLSEIYTKMSEFEIKLIKLDLKSDESSEAEFIKDSFKLWNEIKEELYEVIDYAEKNFNSNSEVSVKKSGYFG